MSSSVRSSRQCVRSIVRNSFAAPSGAPFLSTRSTTLHQRSPNFRCRNIYSASSSRKAEPAAPPKPIVKAPEATSTPPLGSPRSTSSPALADQPLKLHEEDPSQVDWTTSFHGLSVEPFSKEAAAILLAPLDQEDIEIKPDGIIYLPEIKYRRILNKAFGPGGWGLAPRSETIVTEKAVTREYALLAHGR